MHMNIPSSHGHKYAHVNNECAMFTSTLIRPMHETHEHAHLNMPCTHGHKHAKVYMNVPCLQVHKQACVLHEHAMFTRTLTIHFLNADEHVHAHTDMYT